MANALNTSHFIKATLVTAALITSSISSAAHAQDFLATAATRGLERELTLDENPQTLKNLELLNQISKGVCPDPVEIAKLEELERIIGREIAGVNTQLKEAHKNLDKKIEDAKKEIERLQGEIQKEKDKVKEYKLKTEPAVLVTLRRDLNKQRLELEKMEAEISRLDKEVIALRETMDMVGQCLQTARIAETDRR